MATFLHKGVALVVTLGNNDFIQRPSGNTPLEYGGFRNSSPLPSSEVPILRRRRLAKVSAFFIARQIDKNNLKT